MLPAGSSKALQMHSALATGMFGRRWVPQLLSMAPVEGRGGIKSLQTEAPGKAMLLLAIHIELSESGVHLWE